MSRDSMFQGGLSFLSLQAELAARERARAWVLPISHEATTRRAVLANIIGESLPA